MLSIGIKGEAHTTVTKEKLASHVLSGEADVFATPMMIALMEEAAAGSIKPFLDAGKTSVGTNIQVTHVAATPLGMAVRAVAEVTEVSANGRMVTFQVAAYDGAGLIGEGTHVRAILDLQRFQEKTNQKLQPSMQEKEEVSR